MGQVVYGSGGFLPRVVRREGGSAATSHSGRERLRNRRREQTGRSNRSRANPGALRSDRRCHRGLTASSESSRRPHCRQLKLRSDVGSAPQRSAFPEAVTIASWGRESRCAMNEFVQRLKQRKLVQWAAAYVAAAFALIQGIDIVAQRFSWPDSIERTLIIAACIGFFLAMVLAWYHGERGAQRVTGTELVIIVLLVSLGAFFLWRFAAGARAPMVTSVSSVAPVAITEKSIAVLPFENLSEEKQNEYFAEGVQDQILTDLSQIADLKVISRTSVMQYKSGIARNLREICQQLGVAHVVEGSVQRAANKVRVNAQLLDARTDAHLWAQTYDRDLADVFAIQSEIAKAIADQLQAKLSPNEKKAIERPPTTDLAAFDLYSRAKSLLLTANFSAMSEPDRLKVIELLDEAVKRDPSFFDAYCQLAYAHEQLYAVSGVDHTPARLALAEAAVQAATRLRPDAAETHLSRAQYLYFGLRDYAGALAELEIARRALPNDPRLFELTGYILRRRGQQEEGLRNLQRAAEC